MSWASDFHFTVDPKPKTDVFAPSGGWSDIVSPWTAGSVAAEQQIQKAIPEYQSDENLKKAFGIELAKSKNPFEAGCKVFGEDTNKALWASFNWLTDPIVIASRDVYLKTLEFSAAPLDREQLAAKVLALADEKIERNGVMIPTIEAKERINALKLYSDIMGFTGKVEIDNSTKNFTHNELTIKLVKADAKKPLVVDNAPNVKSEMPNDNSLPVTLKLVSGVSR
jgi:hypothetical protein